MRDVPKISVTQRWFYLVERDPLALLGTSILSLIAGENARLRLGQLS